MASEIGRQKPAGRQNGKSRRQCIRTRYWIPMVGKHHILKRPLPLESPSPAARPILWTSARVNLSDAFCLHPNNWPSQLNSLFITLMDYNGVKARVIITNEISAKEKIWRMLIKLLFRFQSRVESSRVECCVVPIPSPSLFHVKIKRNFGAFYLTSSIH